METDIDVMNLFMAESALFPDVLFLFFLSSPQSRSSPHPRSTTFNNENSDNYLNTHSSSINLPVCELVAHPRKKKKTEPWLSFCVCYLAIWKFSTKLSNKRLFLRSCSVICWEKKKYKPIIKCFTLHPSRFILSIYKFSYKNKHFLINTQGYSVNCR